MKKIIYFLVSLMILFAGCDELKEYSYPVDDIPPGIVSNINVENLPGAARITYTLPSDNDLMGVKAVYFNTRINTDSEVFSSAFRDTIDLQGFQDTNEQIVRLITLDRSKNESQPVEVTIKPLTPPVITIGETLSANATFGGLYVSWVNESRANVGIALSADDSTGTMVHNYTYYSNAADGEYTFRGFDDVERRFNLKVVDRWGGESEPLDIVLKPLYEEKLSPKNEFGELKWVQYGEDDGTNVWRGDIPQRANHNSNFWKNAVDANVGTMAAIAVIHGGNYLGIYTNKSEELSIPVYPTYITMDFSAEYLLSRHKLWHWTTRVLTGYAPKRYEIWATRQTKPIDTDDIMESLAYWTGWPEAGGTDAWKNDWDKIAVMEAIPPSGTTDVNLITEDDVAMAKAYGFETDIYPEFTSKPYRYIRFVLLEPWGVGSKSFQIGELEFWGQKNEP